MRMSFRPRSLRPDSRRELRARRSSVQGPRPRLQVRLGAFLVQGDGALAVLAAAIVTLVLIAASLR